MTTKSLHVGRSINWPLALAAQAIGVLGMRGAGKSNLGRVYAEELFGAGIPFVVFDPIGNWHGIRAGRDGRPGGGIPVPIFGGPYGDLDLDRMSGPRIADLILDRRLSCVLDLSHEDFSEADKQRFLAEFGDRLFRRKARESGWLTLIMEEADDYAPQPRSGSSVKGEALKTLGMFQKLVRRGRFKGLGTLMITQRSAAINKDLLYMVGTLIVFRTTGPRDQEAVAGWVKYNAVGEQVVESLATLEDGEAWVIAQESLGAIERVRFRRMNTYDTGATPEQGGAGGRPATLVDIDVPALNRELAAAAAKRKAEDPTELQAEVRKLRAALAAAEKKAPAIKPAPAPKRVEVPMLKDAQVKRLESLVTRAERVMEGALGFREAFESGARAIRDSIVAAQAKAPTLLSDMRVARGRGIAALIPDPPPARVAPERGDRVRIPRAPSFQDRTTAEANGSLGKGERAVLTAVAQYGDQGVTKEQLGILTGYKRSSRNQYVSRLRLAGYVTDYGDNVLVTSEGLAALGPDFAPLPTGAALADYWLNRLGGGEQAILRALLRNPGDWIPRDAISEETGYKRSSRDAYIGRLANRKVVEVARDGTVRAAMALFD